jgi:transcriptional regulator with XRE-family HTH domain
MNNKLGDKILELCKQKGLTQRDLADRIGITEVSVSRYIHGTRIPNANIIKKMAEVLEVNAGEILGEKDKTEEESEKFDIAYNTIKEIKDKLTVEEKMKIVRLLFI